MMRKTNARLAGFTYFFYLATGLTNLALFNQAASGEGTAAKLASIAQHATTVRGSVLLTMCGFVSAVVLGVTLYALTRDEDRDLALLALCCRAIEGANSVGGAVGTLRLLSVATASTAANPDAAAAQAFGSLMLNQGAWTGGIGALCFVLGNTIFSYLFLRARTIPVVLAWLGVFASVLLLIALPLGLVGFLNVGFLMWLPMLVFEVAFALWLIIKGVAMPRSRQSRPADA
jgi:uncharacterized protein DUF4386